MESDMRTFLRTSVPDSPFVIATKPDLLAAERLPAKLCQAHRVNRRDKNLTSQS